MLDFSLLKLNTKPKPNNLSGVATSLSYGQDVVVLGSKNKTTCKLGSLALSHSFLHGNKNFCFRDVIELQPVSTLPVGGKLGRLIASPPVQGDSGAWVVTTDANPAWGGVFFAEDGYRGFCIRATWAHKWAEASVGGQLSV